MSLRASIVYVAVRAIAGVLGMVSLALFVRGLGPEQYGHFTLGIAAAALASNLIVIPLNSTLARLYAEPATRTGLLATIAAIVLVAGVVLVALATLLELSHLSWLAPMVLPAAAVFAAAQGALDLSAQVATTTLEAGRYGRLLLARAAGICSFGALFLVFSAGAPGILLAMALACAIAVAFGGMRISPHAADASMLPRIAAFALPLMLTCAFSYLLQWGDRYLLSRWVPITELGRYSAMADFTQQALLLLFSGLNSAWYPRVVQAWGTRDHAESERLMSRYALMGLALLLPATTGLACVLAPLASSLFGAAYAGLPAALPVLLVLAACVAACKQFFFDIRLLLAERVWWQTAGIALSAMVALLTMSWGLPRHGLVGAAGGLLAGQFVGICYSMWAGRGVLRLRADVRGVTIIVCATLAMLCVLMALPQTGKLMLAVRIATAAASYAFVLLALDFDGMRARCLRFMRSSAT